MKRLYIALTILLSSFLLLSGREVKADTYTYTYPSGSRSTLDDDFFNLRRRVREYIKLNNFDYYIIYINSAGTKVYIFTYNSSISCYTFKSTGWGSILDIRYSIPTLLVSSDTENLNFEEDTSTHTFDTTQYAFVLDTNYPFVLGSSDTWTFLHNGNSISFSENESVPTLYKFYTTFYGVEEDIEEPEEPVDNTPILTTFYTFVLAKIAYFCNYMATNTLFLTMLVIIIVIFIFELIFRRRL